MQGGNDNQPEDQFSYQGQSEEKAVFSGNVDSGQTSVNSSVDPNLFKEAEEEITWEASEYVHHEKGASWYMVLAGCLIILVGLVYFLTKDIFASVAIFIIGIAVGVYAVRRPKAIQYSINHSTLKMGNKFYRLEDFKSFSIDLNSKIQSVIFMPTKRFMPIISVYLPPDQSDKIIQVLEKTLPLEDYRPDLIEKFLEKIRF